MCVLRGLSKAQFTLSIIAFFSLFFLQGWPFTNTVCKMSGLVQGMSVSASVFTLVAIAVDRSVVSLLESDETCQ